MCLKGDEVKIVGDFVDLDFEFSVSKGRPILQTLMTYSNKGKDLDLTD